MSKCCSRQRDVKSMCPPSLSVLAQDPMTGWMAHGKAHEHQDMLIREDSVCLLPRNNAPSGSTLSPTAVERNSTVYHFTNSTPGTNRKRHCVPIMPRASHAASLLTLRSHQVPQREQYHSHFTEDDAKGPRDQGMGRARL